MVGRAEVGELYSQAEEARTTAEHDKAEYSKAMRQVLEQQENLTEEPTEFQLGTMLLNLREARKKLKCFEAYRIDDGKTVVFENVPDADGKIKTIHCSNLLIRVTEE